MRNYGEGVTATGNREDGYTVAVDGEDLGTVRFVSYNLPRYQWKVSGQSEAFASLKAAAAFLLGEHLRPLRYRYETQYEQKRKYAEHLTYERVEIPGARVSLMESWYEVRVDPVDGGEPIWIGHTGKRGGNDWWPSYERNGWSVVSGGETRESAAFTLIEHARHQERVRI